MLDHCEFIVDLDTGDFIDTGSKTGDEEPASKKLDSRVLPLLEEIRVARDGQLPCSADVEYIAKAAGLQPLDVVHWCT